ncbi:hypothetical protein [Clostridium saccharobutylicum]|uniref:Uncharacterized protein n=1 Tax=Clostridium saccharobutylicum DSM 13864 TaxID=1345695 RepID=U5MXX3_CLOSA|nr:hypothetical protein [Clostridium saccharobutylicum]AGX44337.1 hypothetical protein CLSA_c33740 [Clostridium saccharobutylicum DSM 13864]AQR91629.1 hypothetical protein CLOSC_33550 [Clostridium saccharobutylicum]AQS01534.1 hypothetical protein CSACC_33630 [Clostridium saccharobutylicum]AQS11141.1 hypothetical protein CLOBY_32950 [Clostridium saccharobutylicum]AQS15517.1 hypothetical protein CLOSACC_33630 [Clostridium saccharobutylicum]
MTSKEIEFIDITNKQYESLIKMQMQSYKEILNCCKENINDLEKIQMLEEYISQINENVITELEGIKVYNKIFMESVK